MDDTTKYVNDVHSVKDVPLDRALQPVADPRVSARQIYMRNIDTRDGNLKVNDPEGNIVTVGKLGTGTGFGLEIADKDGFILFQLDMNTWKWYDKTYNKNVMQVGLLPDDSYGWAVAKQNYNVADIFA